MATTSDYLAQLQADKQTLVDNLLAKGVEATSDETFTTLAPKVAGIQSGASFEITNASYLFYGNTRTDVIEELCNMISPDCTNFTSMFYNCTNLTEIPQLNTSNGTNFTSMFYNCNLTEIPQLDTSNGTNFSNMFNTCEALTTVSQLNTSKGENFKGMFQSCGALTTVSQLDTSNGTNFESMFYNCKALTTISLLDMGKSTSIASIFTSVTTLTTLGGFKDLGKAYTRTSNNYHAYKLDLSKNTLLTHDSLMNVINNLYDLNLTYDVANGGTLYTQQLVLGSTLMALLSEEEIAIATAKGWTVS